MKSPISTLHYLIPFHEFKYSRYEVDLREPVIQLFLFSGARRFADVFFADVLNEEEFVPNEEEFVHFYKSFAKSL